MCRWLAGLECRLRRWRAGACLAAVLCLFTMPVLAANNDIFAKPHLSVVLSSDEWPPYLGSQLPFHGILSHVVTAAFAKANVDVSYRFLPNNRSLQSARNGTVDGSLGWAPSEERLHDLLYSQAVMSARMVFFQRRSDSVHWQQLSDLSGLRIGTTVGNYYSDAFEQLLKQGVLHTDVAADDLSNLRKLLAHRIDLFPSDEEVGQFLLSRHFSPLQAAQLSSSQAFWQAPLHVVIWRGHSHGDELIARFNQGLQALHDSGDFDRIVREARQACLHSPS